MEPIKFWLHQGKKVTASMVKSLLKNGKVLVRGLTSEKTGKKYDAYIVMQDTGRGVFLNLNFDNVPKPKKEEIAIFQLQLPEKQVI